MMRINEYYLDETGGDILRWMGSPRHLWKTLGAASILHDEAHRQFGDSPEFGSDNNEGLRSYIQDKFKLGFV